MPLNILARKRRDQSAEFILVDTGERSFQRYVVGTATEKSLAGGEWFWGHYFTDLVDAVKYFDGCVSR